MRRSGRLNEQASERAKLKAILAERAPPLFDAGVSQNWITMIWTAGFNVLVCIYRSSHPFWGCPIFRGYPMFDHHTQSHLPLRQAIDPFWGPFLTTPPHPTPPPTAKRTPARAPMGRPFRPGGRRLHRRHGGDLPHGEELRAAGGEVRHGHDPGARSACWLR